MDMALYVLGGSVTGGGGVRDDAARAWPGLVGLDVAVHHRNAIEPSYFLHCAERFAPAEHTLATVLDLCPNMWSANAVQDLVRLVRASVRRTNSSRVGLVAWPRQGTPKHDVGALERVADATGAYVIRVPHNVSLYADATHPNDAGHRLIADAVRRFALAREPRTGVVAETSDGGASDAERCFADARELPLLWNRQWGLIDGGRPRRPKFGWAPLANASGSRTLGLEVPRTLGCAVVATFGFLRSNASGVFDLSCFGCDCSTVRGPFQERLHPFPRVHTRTGQPIRVTDTTSFNVILAPARRCVVEISTGESAVRIDSFYARACNSDDVRNAKKSHKTQHRWFAEHAKRTDCAL